jgi:DNA-binding transcriptional LysR family regulator
MRQAVEELNFLTDSTHGEVRIGGTPVMCGGLLSKTVSTMQAERPHIRFQILDLESERLAEAVRERVIDIGVGRKPALRSEGEISFEKLFEDRLFVVAGAGHPLAKRSHTSLEELAVQCWVLPPGGSPVGRQLLSVFERVRIPIPQSSVTTMSLMIRYELLATNRFVTVLHGSLLQYGSVPSYLSVLPVELSAAVPIGISHVAHRTLSPASELFVNNLRKIIVPMDSLTVQQLRRKLRKRS